jgi:hypothetical protein
LAIVPPDATPETEPMILSASPTAISAFESYVIGLAASEGKMPVEVVTHIAFKPDVGLPYAGVREAEAADRQAAGRDDGPAREGAAYARSRRTRDQG